MKISLTKHAKDRLILRTGLSINDFKKIYDEAKLLPIGKEGKSFRCHELFYSNPKNQCFVSIRDERNSEIITILPIDYHQNIAWSITTDAQSMAKNLFFGENVSIKEEKQEHIITPSKFRVVAIDPFNMKRKNISTFSCEEFSYDIDLFLSHPTLKDTLKEFFKENDKNTYLQLEVVFGQSRKETKLVSTTDFL